MNTINHRIQVFDSNGNYLTQYSGSGSGQLSFPHGLAVDSAGHVVIADRGNERFVVLNFDDTDPAAVPEPATFALACVGFVTFGMIVRRRRRRV